MMDDGWWMVKRRMMVHDGGTNIMEYTKRKNLNRGYMKLEAWQRGMDLFELVYKRTAEVIDFKLRSQVRDASQSVSANIAEGYCRRSLPEYLQFLYTAKGSLGECLTRLIGLSRVGCITHQDVGKFQDLASAGMTSPESSTFRVRENLAATRSKKM